MTNGGDIVVQLQMDDGQFRVAVVKAGDLVNAFKGKLDQTAHSLERLEKNADSMGRKFRNVVMTLGNLRFVAMDINDVLLRLPMAVLKTAGEMERLQQLMTGLSKETDVAARKAEGLANFKFVTGMAKNAPFEIAALGDAFVKFKTAGIDPANGSMQALVDSVARFGGTGEALKRASIAIQQMSGKGVVSMEELRQQLGEAVPTAMQAMADGMGMSMAELTKQVSKGIVTAGPAIKKMLLQMRIDNEGAAEEMMKTWTGMTARLKTEWQLAATYIASNGFGDAAKRVVSQLTSAMQTDEFKRFGIEAGTALESTVNSILEITQAMIRFRSEIALLVEAWLAYKAVTSIIVPLSKTLKSTYKDTAEAIAYEARQVKGIGDVKRYEALKTIEGARTVAAAERARAADTITAKKLETQLIRSENARILADYNRLNAALAAADARGRGGVTVAGYPGAMSKNAVRTQLQDMSMAMAENTRQAAANAAVIAQQERAMRQSAAAVAQKTAEMGKLSASFNYAGIAAGVATGATRAFGSVLNFMGGWVGVAVTALGLLAAWWYKASNAAKEYREAAIRAKQGISTEDDLEKTQKRFDDVSARLANAEKMLASKTKKVASPIGGSMTVEKTASEMEAERKLRDKLLAEKIEVEQTLRETKISLMELSARQESSARQVISERALRDLDAETRAQISALDKQRAAYLEGKDRNNKAVLAKDQEFVVKRNRAFKAGLEAKVAYETGLIRQYEDAAKASEVGSKERIAAEQVIQASQQRLEGFQRELGNVNDTLGLTNGLGGGGGNDKKPKGQSALEGLIEQLAAERARLEAEIEGFKTTAGKADKVAGAVEKIESLLDGGKQYGKVDARTRKVVVDATRTNAELEQQKDDLEKQAKDYQRVMDYIEGMRPEIESAMDLLADPLGVSTRGRMQQSVEKFIGKNLTEIENAAKRMGVAAQTVKSEMRNDAIAGDVAGGFAKVVQETERLNAEMTNNARDAARKRREFENARHQEMVDNLLVEAALSGKFDMSQLVEMRKQANANAAARAKATENEFKTPIQKLQDDWLNASANMEEASARWAEKTMDAMTELVMTGKTDFRSLANSIIADIVKINLQKGIGGAVSSAMSWIGSTFLFADGGIMTEFGSMPLKKYASGGVANSPQLAVFGEGSMNEAFVPLPDGRSIPVTMTGRGGPGNVTISIVVNKDGSTSNSTSGEDASGYRMMAERIRGVVNEELAKQSRPGGMLYR